VSPSPSGLDDTAVHAEPVDALLDRLGASSSQGLSAAEAARRLLSRGPNRLPEQPRDPAWRRLLAQFGDPLVLTLLGAAAIAVVVALSGEAEGGSMLSRFADAIAILLIVILNAVIGYYQEARAEAALDALRKLASPSARVRRGGEVLEVPAEKVVVGDLLELEAGDAVAADARVVHSLDLATEESSLTGESVPTGKSAAAHVAANASLGDRETMVFTGSMIVRGKGRAVVTHTGAHTELGRIGQLIASIGDQKTPLEERLEAFGKVILWVCLGLSAVLLLWGFSRPMIMGGEARLWHVLLLEAVALAVAAIPEGLPAITTITLALGMQRMAKRGAIVRRLPAVETLGAASVICSDKTGTLTQNQMTVQEVVTYGRRFRVTGGGYEPEGDILDEHGEVLGDELPETLDNLLDAAALCNNAELKYDEEADQWSVLGDPTEGALLVLAAKGGHGYESVRASVSFLAELPFDSDRKRMTIIARDARGREVAYVKGTTTILLDRCVNVKQGEHTIALSDDIRAEILAQADAMSERALRVLAFCRREQPDREQVEHELTFLGLVGMIDPPREGVAEAVSICSAAGIRPVMITGDHPLTAVAIAKQINMWEPGDEVIRGTELVELNDEQLDERITRLRVFARTTPAQKLRIVRAYKRAGHVVAMTGDGVNDAPALRESNIGVAMGKMGTDVARQASDLVLADDNFATIVDAVREGRAIYRNIQKFIFFLLSANAGLVVAVFAVSFFGSWPPLTPLMVLWINLVTNGLPALALGVDPPSAQLMSEPPRPTNEGLMVSRDYLGIAYVGAVMGIAAVVLYLTSPQNPDALLRARALAFTLLAVSPLIHSLSCRSPFASFLSARPLLSIPLLVAIAASATVHLVAVLVPGLQPVFNTYPVSLAEWTMVLGLAALVLPAMELSKVLIRKRLKIKRVKAS